VSDSVKITINKDGCVDRSSVSVELGQHIHWINEYGSPVVLTRTGNHEHGTGHWPWAGTGPYTIPVHPHEHCLVIHSGTFGYSVSTCALKSMTNPEIVVAGGK
jgi:hypothetical protein